MNHLKKILKIATDCPETIIIQVLPSGSLADYTEFGSVDAAWEAEKSEAWVMDYEGSQDEAKKEFIESLLIETKESALEAAEMGFEWPLAFGYINEIG